MPTETPTQLISPPARPSAAAPELLAPAGDWDAMRAAVANGADAVYFGVRGGNFNARYRATNFGLDELPEVMRFLHGRNVRGYVAFNTLIFSDELDDAVAALRAIAAARVDAVIVQDLGLAALARRLCPGLHVHGSTQMTLTEPLGIEFVRSLGVRRVILARELSTADVRRITAATDLPVEVFVHGALCVSYSGQCLTSESLGGRSANRGQCAQACRLPYELVVDGEGRDLGDKAYLLSPQDLAAHGLIDELAKLGVCSFKIEGRLKGPHYVAAATQTYRAAIDAAAAGRAFRLPQERELELAQTFSRGFTRGFFDGVNHQELVHARFPKSRGVRVGQVVGRTSRGLLVEVQSGRHDGFVAGGTLHVGDGVVIDEGHPEQDEQGGRIASVTPRGSALPPHRAGVASVTTHTPTLPPRGAGVSPASLASAQQRGRDARATAGGGEPAKNVLEITFDRNGVNLDAVAVGAIVWKTDDPAVRKRLEGTFARDAVARRVPLSANVVARVGELLTITARDDAGHAATVSWDKPLEAAQKFPLTPEVFRDQFGRLGDTPFELGRVEGLDAPTGAMVPKSVLNDLRRRAVEQLLKARDDPERFEIADPDALAHARAEITARFAEPGASTGAHVPVPVQSGAARLHVLTRTLDQLRAVLEWKSEEANLRPSTVYCDFEDVRKYKDAVALARAANVPVGLATIRVVKPGEEGLLRQVADCEPDLVLVRNLAGLSFFPRHAPHLPVVADYALNVANEVTASLLAERGVLRMVPSYDLNWTQLAAMLSRFPADRFEAVVHQHMPMFHMEHCVFAHTLSTGTSYKDCGRPCESHRVDLKDRAGAAHPLVADVGCRNTVFNATAQSAAEFVPRMRQLGLGDFRIELLREGGPEAISLLDRYAPVLAGLDDGRRAWRQLRVLNQLGVTRGTLGE
jgi:putative protease